MVSLVRALLRYLHHNPHRASEYPSRLANALWSEGYYPGKPTRGEVEKALGELRATRQPAAATR